MESRAVFSCYTDFARITGAPFFNCFGRGLLDLLLDTNEQREFRFRSSRSGAVQTKITQRISAKAPERDLPAFHQTMRFPGELEPIQAWVLRDEPLFHDLPSGVKPHALTAFHQFVNALPRELHHALALRADHGENFLVDLQCARPETFARASRDAAVSVEGGRDQIEVGFDFFHSIRI